MNKKLLTAVIGAALAAGPMVASAAPTVYGKLNIGVANIDNGNDTDGDTFAVTDNASRLGVKGDEDLGGGLKAIYNVETTILPTGSTFAGSMRDAFAGLQSANLGSVRLGQFNSVYKSLSTGLEVFADTTGDFTTLGMNGESREANQISYGSPNFNGFEIGVGSSRGETGTTGESNPMMVALTYKAGPLYLGVGMKDQDNTGTTGLDDSTKFVGSYAMGAFSIWAVAETQSVRGTKSSTNQEIDTTHVGASYKMGNNTFAATYTQADSSEANYDATATAVGVIHALSKTTAIKGIYTKVDNDTLATRSGSMVGTITSLAATTAGKNPSALEVQLSISF
jgi:predicted porin